MAVEHPQQGDVLNRVAGRSPERAPGERTSPAARRDIPRSAARAATTTQAAA